jgi:hypothetical protein
MEKIMAKASRNANPASDAMSSLTQAFDSVQSKVEVPAAAREFVQRGATAARERAEEMHEGIVGATARAENMATALVSNYADFARGMVDASLANVRHAFATVEKVAAASSLTEAAQIQADYIRESAASNYERAREAAETTRARMTDGAKALQDEITALVNRQAA